MSTPALTASGLVVRRYGRTLLDDVSLTLAPGRVTALVGPNGAGKSTLLRVLAGELAPDTGAMTLDDRPLAAWPVGELARCRAVLPQESDLSFPFRVEEVVRLGRMPHPGGGDTAADHAMTLAALDHVGLGSFANRLYPTLSGGAKRRVHLARALVQLQPAPGRAAPPARLLLLDEPTASLDLAYQHRMLALARSLATRENIAVLAVLHDLNLALAYADTALVLCAGRLVVGGPATATLTPALVREIFQIEVGALAATGPAPACLRFYFPTPADNAPHTTGLRR